MVHEVWIFRELHVGHEFAHHGPFPEALVVYKADLGTQE